jgi:hypothetical protein
MPTPETTRLSPDEEREYQRWVKHYALKDIDPRTGEPYDDVRYDMRGYWKANYLRGMAGFGPPQFAGAHGPDTFKQHGHPTFSQESQYSRGPWDGGMWIPGTETLLQQPPMAVSHPQTVADLYLRPTK